MVTLPAGDYVMPLGFADLEETGEEGKFPAKLVGNAFKEVCNEVLRALVLEGTRVDGRKHDEIRNITCETGVIPRAHGSALFTRGETQALVTATLGTGRDEVIIDGIKDEERKRFYLHYNFPPFCVGEVRPIRGTSRRELGHGDLAERSLTPLIPDVLDFPYTLRIVSCPISALTSIISVDLGKWKLVINPSTARKR